MSSLCGGDICGVNIEVIPNKKLVQEWFFGENEKSSIVTLTLKKEGNATCLTLSHTEIPDEVEEEIIEGWKTCYLGSLKDMLEMY